jgi:DNA replication protein DnaC
MNQVLVEKVKQDLRQLRLKDMAQTLEAALQKAHKQKQGHLQFLADLVQKQLEGVHNRSLQRRIQNAQFPPNMTFDNFMCNISKTSSNWALSSTDNHCLSSARRGQVKPILPPHSL